MAKIIMLYSILFCIGYKNKEKKKKQEKIREKHTEITYNKN